MGYSEFQRRGFDDDRVSYLFCNNKDVDNYNQYQIQKLQTNKSRYIAMITAANYLKAKKSMKDILVCGFKNNYQLKIQNRQQTQSMITLDL